MTSRFREVVRWRHVGGGVPALFASSGLGGFVRCTCLRSRWNVAAMFVKRQEGAGVTRNPLGHPSSLVRSHARQLRDNVCRLSPGHTCTKVRAFVYRTGDTGSRPGHPPFMTWVLCVRKRDRTIITTEGIFSCWEMKRSTCEACVLSQRWEEG
ncbi:hypothetical protein Bbelb_446520 [Branchiostoma belcheri]|nr:hypothetical protein Bbelb_446520 [Branchiostoma belcheri]